jgi:hypothetical protein
MAIVDNQTPGACETLQLIDQSGRNGLVVAVKMGLSLSVLGMEIESPPSPVRISDLREEIEGETILRSSSELTFGKPGTDVVVTRPAGSPASWPCRNRLMSVAIGPIFFKETVAAKWPFGPVPPDQLPRRKYAGTYDAAWAAERMPLLPLDFDPRFNQVAPANQIVTPHLRGDEPVRLTGFTDSDEPIVTQLPGRMVLVAGNTSDGYFTKPAVLDTVVFHLDPLLVELVWRLSIPTKRSIDEVRYVWVYYPRIRSYEQIWGPLA